MHKKYKGITQWIGLSAVCLLSFWLPYRVKANPPTVAPYTLRTIVIASTGAMEPMAPKPYPYLRLMQWLTPTTHASLIYRQIHLEPGAVFDAQTLSTIKKRLTALPYFSTVSINHKVVDTDNHTSLSDVIIQTKDRFPITVELSLDEGPLCTITHHNAWGYGHKLSPELFLKKRWGFGLVYELPKLHGNYFFGGQYYNQIAHTYRFNHQNVWVNKLFSIPVKEPFSPYYWVTALSYFKKQFTARPPVSDMDNRPYHDYTFILGKIGWVADVYEPMRNVYSLNALEKLPKGGAIEMLYGYQKGEYKNRHYIGIHGIKNIATPRLRYLHASFASGAFLHKQALEEAILKLALAYAGPPIRSCNGARQFIAIDYIGGYKMPQERVLGIIRRDPEALEEPEADNSVQTPIHARFNLQLDSTLHMPIVVSRMRFVFLGFTNFIALYSRNNQLLNQTWVDRYGIGLQCTHATIPWPTIVCKIGYSPLLGKTVSSIELSIGRFANKTAPKPTVVAYS